MAYVVISAFQDRLGSLMYARLTDRVNGNAANATVAQQILDEADAEINSYLSRRYVTPVDTTGDGLLAQMLQSRTLDAAEYHAWRNSPFTSDLPARVKEAYRQLLDWLENVQLGRIVLSAARAATAALEESETPRYVSRPRSFTAEEMGGM